MYSQSPTKKQLEFVEAVDLAPGFQDVCVMGDTLYFHNTRPVGDGVIASYRYRPGEGLTELSSFGEVYRPQGPESAWRMRRGVLGCSPRTSRIAFAPSALGDLRMYDRRGELAWYSVIEGFQPSVTHVRPRGGVRMVFPDDGDFSSSYAVTITQSGGAVLQLARFTRQSHQRREPYAELTAFYVSPSGEGTYLGATEWRYWHIGEDVAVASQPMPYPRLFMLTDA